MDTLADARLRPNQEISIAFRAAAFEKLPAFQEQSDTAVCCCGLGRKFPPDINNQPVEATIKGIRIAYSRVYSTREVEVRPLNEEMPSHLRTKFVGQ